MSCIVRRGVYFVAIVESKSGKPTIRGLRITVEQVLKASAAGVTQHELLEEYPELEQDDIYAVLLYATERVGEEQVIFSI